MSWQEDYKDDHGDGFTEVEEEETVQCSYCWNEYPESEITERRIDGKNKTEKICKNCLEDEGKSNH